MNSDNRDDFSELRALFRSSLFWRADRVVEPLAWVEHVPFAFWVVDILRPKTIVELGTHTGVSYSAMCQAVAKLELNTKCYAIDTWRGDEHAGFYPEAVYSELAAYNESKYSAFSRLVRSTFSDAALHFEDETIDLLHIDGLHTYEAVHDDFATWLPKLSKNAVVLFHDTNVREQQFGVYLLWSEVQKKYRSFEFVHCNGLGVLGLSEHYPPALELLFQANEKYGHTAAVRDIFSNLGRALRLSAESSITLPNIQSALAERDRYISSLLASPSWRMTKPLRSIQKRLKFLNSKNGSPK
ncbi:MAG: class I SAM-dependent methyltransferase [Pseudonocardiaceae bacterium]|nr:MAG: class I SAM-dependent methyltransferase [Pseudonocardiaceae bacterium]